MLNDHQMSKPEKTKDRVFIVGDGKLARSVATNMLKARQETLLLTSDSKAVHCMVEQLDESQAELLTWLVDWPDAIPCGLAIVITEEKTDSKRRAIQQLECRITADTIVAINTESIPLAELQADRPDPSRILGLNWCYPAHLTFFLEIIANAETNPAYIIRLETMAREIWGKDPYTVRGGFSTRARMMAAWAREAIHLVENGYASMESIDRACRNDAGHYLPFAGNFRYMDLMGTYAYGTVMKDLNPELSKDTHVPETLESDLAAYAAEDSGKREAIFEQFSHEIRDLMLKYSHEALDR